MDSAGMTAPCSILSPGSRPAMSSAASVSTNCTRVTQCTATGRPARMRPPHVVRELVQRRQRVVVEQDLHRPEPDSRAARAHPRGAMQHNRCATVPSATAAASAATSASVAPAWRR